MTTAKSMKAPSRGSIIAFRLLTAAIFIGAAIVGAIGFAGSYDSLKELAEHKGFGDFSYFLPIGVDAGIISLLSLDLWLTRMRIPMPLMRRAAWILTVATIYFNANAGVPQPTGANPYPSLWDDPVAVGMHSVLPLSFVAIVEAARHAVLRLAKLAEDESIEKVRPIRWFLDPLRTFRLWRRMRLWEITSYAIALLLEKERLVYLYRLRARFGSKRKAPVEVALPLRLADYGEPLPPPPLTEREEAELAEAEAREAAREAEREARARQEREDQEAAEQSRREAEREAREAEREAAREAHEREIARLAAESEARIREARETALLEAEAHKREARIEAERHAREEARRREDAQAKAAEAERREAARAASRVVQEQPRESHSALADSRPSPASRTTSSRSAGTSREARRAQREDAELHAASLILANKRPTSTEFGGLYNQGETWGGDRLREASKRLVRDLEFRDRAEKLRLEQMLTSSAAQHAP